MSDRLMLLDSASLYFRAFFGVPDTVQAPDGRPVNAVRGFLDMIAKLVSTYEPTELVACWDDDWRPQWRVDLVPTYKTHRVAQPVAAGPDVEVVPDPLEAQVPIIREALEALGIPIVGAAEHEADDVIGSLATQSRLPVDVVTGDRDLFQLVDDARGIRVIYTGRGMSNLDVLTDDAIIAKYNVRPDQYADFATMRGDASDGLPGVAGVGDKTAAALLAAHGDLDGILAAAERGEGMTAGVRAKIAAASDYLAVAPQVVRVVRDLELGPVDARIRATGQDVVDDLAARWALGTAATRAAKALRARA
ncbi:5'-3' exonuclease [Microbacterium imperiale]|uniref:5'-3' exonuclease n=1 Tax=Microbacterium imperiale TaxID=33884 RepID=A0A9W6M299_9MICO|nr:5'-3' exonuclease [Microbacterium imperiale]MBP2419889.1 5'-3' exonuclease [Microbacterium imperiale]MDS0198247.1 5'-3' exonuclease [Microbacterium imperiale]BFE40228.1 5'-3' exonuclease [Microbacterium imperiale]GLJ78795.1 5'-3' exonuclease [Microbacterium imperiale]